jgi:NAD(P)-dependent dehydrogenase (short-subunit alcohol dehydrogenase family)
VSGFSRTVRLAPAYVFFASDADSSYITGEVLAVMGGGTAPG